MEQSNADNAATADKYAKMHMALYAQTGDAAMKAAEQAAAAAANASKAQIKSPEAQQKTDKADEQFKNLNASMQDQVSA